MPVMVPIMLPKPRLISMKKNITDQNGDPGKWVMASVKAMKARPVPWTAYRERPSNPWDAAHAVDSTDFACGISTYLVEFILQETGLQTQLGKAVLLYRLDDAVHISVVRWGEVGKVHVRRNEIVTQDVGVKVSKDLFSISADINK